MFDIAIETKVDVKMIEVFNFVSTRYQFIINLFKELFLFIEKNTKHNYVGINRDISFTK